MKMKKSSSLTHTPGGSNTKSMLRMISSEPVSETKPPPRMLPTAALGLTCREAFEVLSQHETLRLQQRVVVLEAAVLQWRPRVRLFETQQDYDEVLTAAGRWLDVWLHENLHVCSEHDMSRRDVGAICDQGRMREAIAHAAWIVTEDEMYARGVAADAYDALGVALQSAHGVVLEEAAWWEEQGQIVFIVGNVVTEFLQRKCERDGAVVVLLGGGDA